MLNFKGMLMAPVTPLSEHKPTKDRKKNTGNTEEQKQRRAQTMRRLRNERWKALFALFGGSATCAQLATRCEYTPASINAVLSKMRVEDPPVVIVVGKAKRTGGFTGGREPLIYQWVGE